MFLLFLIAYFIRHREKENEKKIELSFLDFVERNVIPDELSMWNVKKKKDQTICKILLKHPNIAKRLVPPVYP